MVGGSARRDSWDAIAKTKSLLSYNSLESLANLANDSLTIDNSKSTTTNNVNGHTAENYTQNSSSNYSSLKKFSSSEYNYSPKVNNDSLSNSRGILKNKVHSTLGLDTTDSLGRSAAAESSATTTTTSTTTTMKTIQEKQQYLNSDSSLLRNSSGHDKLVSGSALEMLAIHRPTSFTLDSSLEANKIAVIVTGN